MKQAAQLEKYKEANKHRVKSQNSDLRDGIIAVEISALGKLKSMKIDEESLKILEELEKSVEKLYKDTENEIEQVSKQVKESKEEDFVKKSYEGLEFQTKWTQIEKDIRTQLSIISEKIGVKFCCFDCLKMKRSHPRLKVSCMRCLKENKRDEK